MPSNDNLIDALKREREREERLADEAGTRGDTPQYLAHAAAERAFKRAIEIVRQYT
jgi:hypothetical protein